MKHESGHLHVTGAAEYVDDLTPPAGCLVAIPVTSTLAHGVLEGVDATEALALPGVVAVLTARDIPGDPLIGPIVHDEPLLAMGHVHFVGQAVALVIAQDRASALAACKLVKVTVEALPPVFDIPGAIAAEQWLGTPHTIARGDIEQALGDAHTRINGELCCGGQDHFYLETQAALSVPQEDGSLHVHSSTQHPTEVQKMVARCLDLPANRVVCEVPRMGGGFGGKESQATHWACYAALGTWRTGKACKVWLNRDEDMCWTGKRHPMMARYRAGFDTEGTLVAFDVELFLNGGWSEDLSIPILDRALFHLDNSCYIETLRFHGRACRTNLPSNTAYRGFGGPQGMLVVEHAINTFCEATGRDPAAVRAHNFYVDGQPTPYGQPLDGVRLERIWSELSRSSDYAARRAAIDAHNATGTSVRRGIGMQAVKFGISFTASLLNQAGALVLVYADGSVQLNHGGTEMGQGLHTKMLKVCSQELGVPESSIRVMRTATDKVPSTSATAASSGTDLNGAAVKAACEQIRERMDAVREELSGQPSFAEVATQCWVRQVSLAASGFYATPGIGYDRDAGRGRPFHYFAYGASVTEVEVDTLTGEYRTLRADILHDVGDSIVPAIDRGQVEGGYVQGLGWLTMEEVLFTDAGRLITSGPSTYKIPAAGDAPLDFRVALLDKAPQPGVIHGSKAVGEPPFMLAISVITAMRHALGGDVSVPATPEAVLRAWTASALD